MSTRSAGYETAVGQAFDALATRDRASLVALGATERGPDSFSLPVLGDTYVVDRSARTVGIDVGGGAPAEARIEWKIIVLHYLLAPPSPPPSRRWVGFGDFPEGRVYGDVFRGRVLGRIVAAAGDDPAAFGRACETLGGERAEWGDVGYRFRVFPLVSVSVAWFRGDDEFPPDAGFLYPDNILSFLPIEDIIVMAERVAGRLSEVVRAGGKA